LPVVTGAFLVGIVTRDALATVGLAGERQPAAKLVCSACGADQEDDKVRRDPRSGGIPLCVDCLGRTSANALRRQAD
jgi:NAD-dependent SIR2 family protein deacetylase